MGALGGHMSHLHENPTLTFKEIKDVFAMASNGELEGTEKTDGQNLFISYSVQTGRAKAARNKGNIKTGGMTAEELAKKFTGRGALETAFVESFETFEKAVQSLDPETQMAIFGPDASIYYNAEIQDPRTANVINYDTKTLNIHQVGHAEFDKETGNIKDVNISKNARALDKVLKQMQQAIVDDEYNIQRNAIKRLRALDDDTALNIAVEKLENEINKHGISDKQTIADYQVAKIVPFIEKQVELPEKNKKLLLKRVFGMKGVTFNHVVKGLDPKSKEIVRNIVKSSTNLVKNATLPIEMIIHDFAVEMLKGLHSAFILDNPKEVMRLRNEVSQAIQAIEASGDEEAMIILQKQMKKLKSVENISTAVEGFVFDYNGKSYKFTGHFAPANQILGLFRYGRGSSPPLQALGEQEADTGSEEVNIDTCEKVAVIPGAFKPPHRGHYDMIEHYSNIVGPEGRVYVLISPLAASERVGFEPETQADVGVKQSEDLWEIYISNLPNVEIEVSDMRSPVRAAYEFVESSGRLQGNECVILGTSTKGGDQSRFARALQTKAEKDVQILNPMDYAFEPKEQLSATGMREAAKAQNIDALLSFLPKHALKYQDEIVRLFGISDGGPAEIFPEAKKKEADLSTILCGIIEEALEEDFQTKMKRRLKRAHRAYLDAGGQSPGSSFPNKRPKVSNAFLAREAEENAWADALIENLLKDDLLLQEGITDLFQAAYDKAKEFIADIGDKAESAIRSLILKGIESIRMIINTSRKKGIGPFAGGKGKALWRKTIGILSILKKPQHLKTAASIVMILLKAVVMLVGGLVGPGAADALEAFETAIMVLTREGPIEFIKKFVGIDKLESLIGDISAIEKDIAGAGKIDVTGLESGATATAPEAQVQEMSSMAAGDVQGAMMGRKNGKATSPFEDLDVEKENEDERKRSHTIKGRPLTEEDGLVEEIMNYLLEQNGAL